MASTFVASLLIFVFAVMTALGVSLWRIGVMVYESSFDIFTFVKDNKLFLLIGILLWGTFISIKRTPESEIFTIFDELYECGSATFIPPSQFNNITFPGIFVMAQYQWIIINAYRNFVLITVKSNDIVVYVRSAISDFIAAIQDIINLTVIEGISEGIVAITDFILTLNNFWVFIPSLQIPLISQAQQNFIFSWECFTLLMRDFIVTLARGTVFSEDCDFCAFQTQVLPDICALSTGTFPGVTRDCSPGNCKELPCRIVRCVFGSLNAITFSFLDDFWEELSDVSCCLINLLKRPIFFLVGIIENASSGQCFSITIMYE